jgi:DNA repair protein RecN (Recombination protein N)
MLAELRVENLLLIERAELCLSDGLNVLTGETGAGKSVLAHALDLLMGARPKQGIVRPGAGEAYVEGCFLVSPSFLESLPPGCAIEGLEDDREAALIEVVLGRRVMADGRTRAYLNGRSAAVGDLRAIACELIAFHGQHEHRRLTDVAEQLELLDGFCGSGQQQRRDACAQALARMREAQADLVRLGELAAARDRELGLLEHELGEIDELDPTSGEQEQLQAQRERLRQIDALRAAALLGAAELAGDEDDAPGAVRLIASACARIGQLHGVDESLDALGERVRALALEAEDLAAELRRHGEDLDAQEGDLQRLEERLAAIERLCRKHGGDLDAMLVFADHARARRQELLGAEVAAGEAAARLKAAQGELTEHVEALRAARKKAAPKLAAAMRAQLASLAMPDARFEVALAPCEPSGSGGDAVEFMLAPNPGVAAGPLRETASGGELSRTMLALSAIADGDGSAAASASQSHRTLVFDEIDAGIGGHTARAVGERLRELAAGRQVLCITHLPQIASLAQTHFSIAKGSTAKSTSATVVQLGEDQVVGELVRMLGANEDDAAATRHAEELLSAA